MAVKKEIYDFWAFTSYSSIVVICFKQEKKMWKPTEKVPNFRIFFLLKKKFWNFWTMFFLCVFLEVQMQKNHKSLLWPPIIEKQLLLRLWKNVVTTEYFHELSVLTKIPWKRFRISKLTCFKLRVYVPAFSVIIVYMYVCLYFFSPRKYHVSGMSNFKVYL